MFGRCDAERSALAHDLEAEPAVGRGVARAGLEPEQHRVAQLRERLPARAATARALGELGAARHQLIAFTSNGHMAEHGSSIRRSIRTRPGAGPGTSRRGSAW